MNIKGLSNSSLRLLYDGIRHALVEDDKAASEGRHPEHEVRTSPDWKQWARTLSDEMVGRGMTFQRIDWWEQ